MKALIKFLMKFLNDKAVQSLLIETAEKLAKKTACTLDDELVKAFKELWQKQQ